MSTFYPDSFPVARNYEIDRWNSELAFWGRNAWRCDKAARDWGTGPGIPSSSSPWVALVTWSVHDSLILSRKTKIEN